MGLFQTIGNAIANFFKKEVPVLENALTGANNFVNVVKTFMGSTTGETLQALADALLPGVAPLVFAGLNTFFTDFGLVVAELNKTPAQIAADGFNALGKLTGDSKTLALSNVAAIIGNAANGGTATLQQHIVTAPLTYNSALLDTTPSGIVNEPVGTVLPNGNQVLSPNA
jgi:hypothetical protein